MRQCERGRDDTKGRVIWMRLNETGDINRHYEIGRDRGKKLNTF